MKIRCKCGNIIAEGEVGNSGKGRKIFNIEGKPRGTIIKNKSKNPDDWSRICSTCQSAELVTNE